MIRSRRKKLCNMGGENGATIEEEMVQLVMKKWFE